MERSCSFTAETDSSTISCGELGLSWTLPGRSSLILFFTWAEEHKEWISEFQCCSQELPRKTFYNFPRICLNVIKEYRQECDGPLACLCLDGFASDFFYPWMESLSPCGSFSFQGWHHIQLYVDVFIDTFGSIFSFTMTFSGLFQHKTASTANSERPCFLCFSSALKSKLPQCLGFHQDIHNLSPKVQTSWCVLLMCTERVCAWVHVHMHLPHQTEVLITRTSAGDCV